MLISAVADTRSMPLPAGYLAPPLFKSKADFLDSGRTLAATQSPSSNALCVYPTRAKAQSDVQYESNVYLASPETMPLRSQLVADTSVQWVKTRDFFENAKILPDQYQPLLPGTLEGFSMTIKGHIRRLNERDSTQEVVEHYQTIDAAFDLFLLLTAGSSDPGVFGEDLLDWLNRHYISPTSEEGMRMADLEEPWLDSGFWNVLLKYAFRGIVPPLVHFLGALVSHPSQYLKPIAKKLISLLNQLPRAVSTPRDQHAMKRREWMQVLATLRSDFEGIPAKGKSEPWYDPVNDMLDIFEGDELVIKRIGRELGIGWLEIICVWGLWGDSKLERYHLPELVNGLIAEMSLDPTEVEETMLMHFFVDDLPKAVESAMLLDLWLGAHLAEIMQAQGLLDSSPQKSVELSLRDFCVLEYAETILNDPGQWMIAIEYMQTCGPRGLSRGDEVASRIPIDFSRISYGPTVQPDRDTVIPPHVLRYCRDNKREWVLESVIRTAARALADNGQLGEALSYSLSADDPPGIDRVVRLVMSRYSNLGGASLIDFANELPQTISSRYRLPGPRKYQGLSFLLNYADYHRYYASGDFRSAARHLASMFEKGMVPYSSWLNLFDDAQTLLSDDRGLYFSQADGYQLLQKVEQYERRSLPSPHATSRDPNSQRKLYALRLSFANYFARLALSGLQTSA